MCHFQICLDLSDGCNNVNGMKTWADYLFPCLDGSPEEISFVDIDEEVKTRMKNNGYGNFILEEDIGPYEPGELFKSYHHQDWLPLSRQAILAGYLSLWLKRCIIPSPPRDGISSMACFPAIQLVFGEALGLLSVMVCYIQRGHRMLTKAEIT